MRPVYIPPFLQSEQLDAIEKELLALQWETKRTARHEYFMADGKDCPCVMTCKVQDFSVTLPPCPACGGTTRLPVEYSYGRKDDGITYTSKPWSPRVFVAMMAVSEATKDALRQDHGLFNGCFLNKYKDQHQHLHWHADDFAGMDPAAPIAVMSFGAEREIWIKHKEVDCPVCKGEKVFVNTATGARNTIEECSECRAKGKVPVKGAVPPEDRFLLQRGSLFIMPPGFQEVMLHRIPKHPEPCGWRISLTFRKFL